MAGTSLNLEIRIGQPTGAPVVSDYLAGEPEALAFYAGHFRDLSAYEAKAAEVDARFDSSAREEAVKAVGVPPGADPDRLERFVAEGGYFVTTGQQPGLFGGPLYCVYKGLTAVRLARDLEARLGRPVLPLFWVASEDHDWAEANHTSIVGVDNELHTPQLETSIPDTHPPLHRIPLGPDITQLLDKTIQSLPNTDFSPHYFELLRDSMTGDETLPGSFRAILEDLLGPFGLFFTDAAHPALKARSRPWLEQELERSAELEQILTETGRRLEEAGYGLQVSLLEGGVNLFLEGAAGRERLYRDDEGFHLRTSGERLSAADIRARTDVDPSILSPNVLLRPVVESAVFPTLSYVAGPGEMAYFAQLAAYFQAYGIRMPVIHPRFGATVVEAKIRKVLDKFGLDVADLDRPFHEIASEIARDEVPGEVRATLGALRGAIGKSVAELQNAVKSLDPTLKGPVQHLRSQAFDALSDLEKKIVHAVKRENEIALAQLEKAQLHLFPGGKPQERVLNPFYYLTRYGSAFLQEVFEGFQMNLS